jgi:hypothetical protein
MVDELRQDVRYALRQLGRNPAFAGAAIITLAVGIGANSAVFSVVNGVLLEPLPYESPDELVTVNTAFPDMGFEEFWLSPPEYYELREWNQVFEDMGAYRVDNASVETLDRPMRVPSAVASWTFFTTLGVRAELGRTFLEEEDRNGAEPTVVISHGLWQRGFGGDPSIIGSTIRVTGQNKIVVGVLPETVMLSFPSFIFFSQIWISSSWSSISLVMASNSRLFLTFFCCSAYFLISFSASFMPSLCFLIPSSMSF